MKALPNLCATRLHLVLAERSARRKLMTALTVRLALNSAVRLLDGGNSFDAYGLARLLRSQTGEWQAALKRISVARAFTCYQAAALLGETPVGPFPILVLDLLDTFYDESVRLPERRRLLNGCLLHLERLSVSTSVAVSACLPGRGQPGELLEMLAGAAGHVWSFEVAPPLPPLRLL